MNLKGLTTAQRKNLRAWLIRDVEIGSRTRMKPLLEASIGRIAANRIRQRNAEAERESVKLTNETGYLALRLAWPCFEDQRHVTDWLQSSLAAGAPWLSNVDAEGRPKKLMKCSGYEDLVREADKAMDRLNAQDAKKLGADDEQEVARLAEGFTLVRLLTQAALDLESRRMRHCVGHGSYDHGLQNGSSEIYSLRDDMGRPALTVEVVVEETRLSADRTLLPEPRTAREVSQVSGRRNAAPDPALLDILRPYVQSAGWEGAREYWPTVTDAAGVRHDVRAIPAGAVFADLFISDRLGRAITLPPGLTVTGRCYIGGPAVTVLPEDMAVGGDLTLEPRHPMTLPDSLRVGGRIKTVRFGNVIAPEHLKDQVEQIRYRIGRGIVLANYGSEEFEMLRDFEDIVLRVNDEPEEGGPRP